MHLNPLAFYHFQVLGHTDQFPTSLYEHVQLNSNISLMCNHLTYGKKKASEGRRMDPVLPLASAMRASWAAYDAAIMAAEAAISPAPRRVCTPTERWWRREPEPEPRMLLSSLFESVPTRPPPPPTWKGGSAEEGRGWRPPAGAPPPTRRMTSTTMTGSAVRWKTSIASSWVAFWTSSPLTWKRSNVKYAFLPLGRWHQNYKALCGHKLISFGLAQAFMGVSQHRQVQATCVQNICIYW